MKKTLFRILAVCILLGVIAGVLLFRRTTDTLTGYAMNTVISITVKSRNPQKDARAAIEEVKRIDALMSATRTSSDIGRINSAAAGEPVKVSREVFSLMELCGEISQKTGGAFDISINPISLLWDIASPNPAVPAEKDITAALSKVNYKDIVLDSEDSTVTLKKEGMSVSLGAVAKGYAADRVKKLLKDRGVKEAIVDLGGNVYVIGSDKTVGIQTPFKKRGEYFTTCTVSDASVVTSGSYERYFKGKDGEIYHHILNPKDGYPAKSGLESVTVICENSALADGLSTAFYVLGAQGSQEVIKKFDGVRGILLTDRGEIVSIDN